MSACLAAVLDQLFLLGVVSVSPVSPVSPAAKGTCLVAVFCFCGLFVCGFWLLLFGFLCVCCFPLLLACLSSFTDWCLVHRQQSREQKKNIWWTTGRLHLQKIWKTTQNHWTETTSRKPHNRSPMNSSDGFKFKTKGDNRKTPETARNPLESK